MQEILLFLEKNANAKRGFSFFFIAVFTHFFLANLRPIFFFFCF